MYSMEKLARGTILTREQRWFKEKRWNDCKARHKVDTDKWRKEKPCRGYSVNFAEYADRPRGKIKE